VFINEMIILNGNCEEAKQRGRQVYGNLKEMTDCEQKAHGMTHLGDVESAKSAKRGAAH